jgi:hypothetical protein
VLYATARDPKKYVLIKASNHRFTGAREEFYTALGDAVTWMKELTRIEPQITRKNTN